MNSWFPPGLVQCLGWTLVHFLWQGLAIAALLVVTLRLLRSGPASRRYAVACLALLAMAIAPVATFRYLAQQDLPPLPLPLLAVEPGSTPEFADTGTREVKPGPTVVFIVKTAPPKVNFSQRLEMLLPWLVTGWSAGVLALSVRLLFGWLQIRRLRRGATETLGPPWSEKLAGLARRLGISRPLRLCRSALVEVPTVIGWLRPVILLPASCLAGLTPGQLEAILAHELAHIRRHDYLVNLLQSVVETLLFYHPAVWWVSRCIREERENCCDDLAVSLCGDRVAYARALATLEELRPAPAQLAVAASGAPLLQRIRRLAGQSDRTANRSGWLVAGFITTAAVIIALSAGVRGDRALADEQKESTPAVSTPATLSETNQTPVGTNTSGKARAIGGTNRVEFSVEELVQEGKRLFEAGKLDEAAAKLRQAYDRDGNNATAYHYLSLIEEKRNAEADKEKMMEDGDALQHPMLWNYPLRPHQPPARDGEIKIEDSWDVPVPREAELPKGSNIWSETVYIGRRRQTILSKLDRIRIDSVKYDRVPLSEVIINLATLARSRDPDNTGVNFILDRKSADDASSGTGTIDPVTGLPVALIEANAVDVGRVEVTILPGLTDIRLADVLDAIIEAADKPITYSIGDYGVIFSTKGPERPEAMPLYTRLFVIDPDNIYQRLTNAAPVHKEDVEAVQKYARMFLEQAGVDFSSPPGKSVFFNPENGRLLVRATARDLEKAARVLALPSRPVSGNHETHEQRPDSYERQPLRFLSKGRQAIVSKLDRIRIDRISYDGIPLDEVLKDLTELAKSRDPDKTGINFLVKMETTDVDAGAVKVKIIPGLTDVRLADVLDAIPKAAYKPIKYGIEDYGVVFSLKGPDAPLLYTRTFHIGTNVFRPGEGGFMEVPSDNAQVGAAAPASGLRFVTSGSNSMYEVQMMIRNFFTAAGVDFDISNPANIGKAIFFNDRKGILMVRATAQDLDIIGAALEALIQSPPLKTDDYMPLPFSSPSPEHLIQTPPTGTDDNGATGFDWFLGNVLKGGGTIGGADSSRPEPNGVRSPANPLAIAPSSGTSGATTPIPAARKAVPQGSPPQVRIRAQFAEIDERESGTSKLDVLLGKGVTLGKEVTWVEAVQLALPPNAIPIDSNLVQNASCSQTNAILSHSAAVLTEAQYRACTNALVQHDGVDFFTAPELTTEAERQAQIQVGLKLVETVPCGTILDAAPHLSKDGYSIELALCATVNEFLGYDHPREAVSPDSISNHGNTVRPRASATPLPRFLTRQMTAKTTLYDGQTAVLSGIASPGLIKIKDKVPLPADMPLVGRLFRSESSNKTRKNLIVLVTATLINPDGSAYHSKEQMASPRFKAVPPQTVMNRQTDAIGGLTPERLTNIREKVPLLGDMPLVGRLFRSETRRKSERDLDMFLPVELVNPESAATIGERLDSAPVVAKEASILITRTFHVDPDLFRRKLEIFAGVQFVKAQTTNESLAVFEARRNVEVQQAFHKFCSSAGVDLSPTNSANLGKAVYFNERKGLIMVRGTQEDLDKIGAALEKCMALPPEVNLKTVYAVLPMEETGVAEIDRLFQPDEIGFASKGAWHPGKDSIRWTRTGNLTETEYRSVMHALEQCPEANIFIAPAVTTLDGRSAQIGMSDFARSLGLDSQPQGKEFPTNTTEAELAGSGAVLGLFPVVSADKYTVQLTMIPSTIEFLGYDHPGQLNPDTGDPRTAPLPLPHFRMRQVATSVPIPDAETIVLSGIAVSHSDGSADLKEKGASQPSNLSAKKFLIFVTPTIIMPDGSRYHSEKEAGNGPTVPPLK